MKTLADLNVLFFRSGGGEQKGKFNFESSTNHFLTHPASTEPINPTKLGHGREMTFHILKA
jgi:hypothetical protein